MNANVNVKKGQGGRTRRAAGCAMLVVGLLAAWAHAWQPQYSFATRWFSVGTWERGVQVQWGNAQEREEYRQALGRSFKGGSPVYPRGQWDIRVPREGVFDAPVYLVAFGAWPFAVAGLLGGGALVWSARRGLPGERQMLAGGAAIGCGAVIVVVWVCSAWTSKHCPLGVASALAQRGVVYIDLPPGDRDDASRFAFNDLNPATRAGWQVGEAAWLVLWDWGVNRPGKGAWFRVWMPLWAPAVGLVAGGAWLIARGVGARRRWRAGACGGCGYNLRGIGDGKVCPECGKERDVGERGSAGV